MVLNEMFRHTDFMKMSAYTMGVSTLDYNSTAAVYNSRGLLLQVVPRPVRVIAGCSFREIRHNLRRSIRPMATSRRPAPGSPTYPLDMVAALTADRKFLTIAVVNGRIRNRSSI